MFLFKNSIMSTFFAFRGLQSVAFMKCSAILTKNIAGSSGIELPILFASIESIDTFVSIDDFDTFSIVSPITIEEVDHYRSQVVPHNEDRILCGYYQGRNLGLNITSV